MIMLSSFAFAISYEYVSNEEQKVLASKMEDRGIIASDMEIKVLYGRDGEPNYLLGYTNDFYLIMDRATYTCMETGEGNPYSRNLDDQLYYGGLLCYFAETSDGLFDLVRNKIVENILETEYAVNIESRAHEANHTNRYKMNLRASVTSTQIIPNAYDYIRTQSFGYNDDNTCTAIAVCMVLNYLDKAVNDGVVPDKYESQTIYRDVNSAMCNDAAVEQYYPNTHAFHKEMVSHALGAATYGGYVERAVDRYTISNCIANGVIVSCGSSLSETPENYVVSSIENDMPSMVTFSFFGDYQFHSMPAYGVRFLSDGSKEYLVHTGWWETIKESTGSKHVMPLVWAPEQAMTYLYKFVVSEI